MRVILVGQVCPVGQDGNHRDLTVIGASHGVFIPFAGLQESPSLQ